MTINRKKPVPALAVNSPLLITSTFAPVYDGGLPFATLAIIKYTASFFMLNVRVELLFKIVVTTNDERTNNTENFIKVFSVSFYGSAELKEILFLNHTGYNDPMRGAIYNIATKTLTYDSYMNDGNNRLNGKSEYLTVAWPNISYKKNCSVFHGGVSASLTGSSGTISETDTVDKIVGDSFAIPTSPFAYINFYLIYG